MRHDLKQIFAAFRQLNLKIKTTAIETVVQEVSKEFGNFTMMRYWFFLPPDEGTLIIRPNKFLSILETFRGEVLELERYCIISAHQNK